MNSNSNNGHSASTANFRLTSEQPSASSFDIRDHVDKLEPGKSKNKFVCPVCGGRNLGIDFNNGAYQCFTSECAPADIREAIRPLADFLAERRTDKQKVGDRKPREKKIAPKVTTPVPIPAGLKVLRLPESRPVPQPCKPTFFPKRVPANAVMITYTYSDSQQVHRYEWLDPEHPKGRDKDYYQSHIDSSGQKIWKKGTATWPAYRIDEVVELLKEVPDEVPILLLTLEGEPNVDLARLHAIAGITFQGSSWTDDAIKQAVEALRATGKNITLGKLRDNDSTGVKKGNQVQSVCNRLGFPCAVIDPVAIYPDIPEKGDIREILEAIDSEEFVRRVEAEFNNFAAPLPNKNFLTSHAHTREDVTYEKHNSVTSDYIPDTAPVALQNFVQKAEAALYAEGHWKSIGGVLYQFTGTYYEERSEKLEKRRIRNWLNTYSEMVRGFYVCNRAKSGSVDEVYNWVVLGRAVDIKEVNPPGLNCSNGVVTVNRDGSHTLVPHSPDKIYTYVGCKYDPDIDTSDCDRLLECLDPQQREIFMRTVAASLCLPLARLKMSRVKGLLCHGDGSNGKDTLRTVLVKVLGRGVTGKTLKDFQIYDTGRKFPLAGLENSLCNWSSENSDATKLDKLQSLKQFISGDELTIEHKGRGEYPYEPQAIFLANCNVLPSISTDSKAITSRYCILSFTKIYDTKPDTSKGELQADPRFKLDQEFVTDRIAPAFLKRMLERIPLLLAEGIDYGSGDAALREAQEKSQHLWQFVRDLGYEAGNGERVYAKDLWQELKDWYEDAGILEIERDRETPKLVWNELPGRDTPVKAINQLFARLSELFPKLEKHRHTEAQLDGREMGNAYYLGICKPKSEKSKKSSAESAEPCCVVITSAEHPQKANFSADASVATILTQSATADAADDFPIVLELCNIIAKLSASDKQKLIEFLVPSETVKVKKGLRVRYIGTKYAEQLAGLDLIVDEINLYREITCTKPDGSFTTWLSPKDLTAD